MGCNCGGSQQAVTRAPLGSRAGRRQVEQPQPKPEEAFGPLSPDHYAPQPTYWQGPPTTAEEQK